MSASTSGKPDRSVGSFRWVICALLFLAATLNYVDRQVIGFLKPTLQQEFGWSEMDYADIVFAFQVAYAIGLLFAGRMMDKLGTRLGFTLAIVIWSLAAMAHAEATWFGPGVAAILSAVGLVYTGSVAGFIAARFVLGLGESGNFSASIKAVAEWFPKKERALATGIFNSGTNVGALLVPATVPWITATYGWYWAFVATGAIGFLWLFLWWPLYKSPEHHSRVSPAELAFIRSDPPDSPVKVPLSVPPPLALLNVTVVVLVTLAGFPLASCDCTVTLNAVPAVPVVGTVV
jgi:ACS family hexuronate transporter-like MFS transporter